MATRSKDRHMPPRHRHKPPTVKADETFAKYLAKKVEQAIQRSGWVGDLPPVGVVISDDHCIVAVTLPNGYQNTQTPATLFGVVNDILNGSRIGEPYGMVVISWVGAHTYEKVTRKPYSGSKYQAPDSVVAANEIILRRVNEMREASGNPLVSRRHPITRKERYTVLDTMERQASAPDMLAGALRGTVNGPEHRAKSARDMAATLAELTPEEARLLDAFDTATTLSTTVEEAGRRFIAKHHPSRRR